MTAVEQRLAGNITHLDGAVTIEADRFVLQADKAEVNVESGEIVAHGDVRVKLK